MTTIAATVAGLGSAGSIAAFVAAKLRLSRLEQDPTKTERLTLLVDAHPNQPRQEI
jgi:hypothetical protein